MKLVQSLIVAALVAVPVVSFAQAQQPVTRAQVRAELVQLEKAGYSAATDDAHYPQNIEAAQARIEANQGSAVTAYGGVAKDSSASGSRKPMNHASAKANAADVIGLGDIYAHS
jgi:hypothetical protein